jgi:VWFA-related protein
MRGRALVVVLVGALTLPPVQAAATGPQAAPPAKQKPEEVPTFGVGTAAVTLDIVVRDRKGRAVRDLKASDFEVFEDGVRQTVDSFQVFGKPLDEGAAEQPRAAAAPVTAAPVATAAHQAPAASPAEDRPQVIAFVFDRLSANARNMAHKAALTYLDGGHVEGDLVGVFTIDLALRTILPFTRDAGLIRAGLERAASQANTDFASNREQMRGLVDAMSTAEQTTDAASGAAPSGPGAGQLGSAIGAAAGAAALNQAVSSIQVQMLRSFEALERDQQGYASTNSLLAVVNGLKDLPGRKTVVFFSEGLVIPANIQAQFRSVINAANRSLVSVYAMDAGGLRASSMNEETRKEMLQAMNRRLSQLDSGRDAGGGSMSKALERNEDLLRLNPESGLGQLASETGGFLIHDTNDAGSAFRRIAEDMRFHYLLAYSPTNEHYDGRFRSISVKLARSGVELQTRKGYFAVRPEASSPPILSYEAPAVAQLDRSPRPDAFPVRVIGLAFPEAKRPGLVPVLVEVPGSAISYAPDKDKKTHNADLSIVVQVRDQARRVVDRLSQHYQLSAPDASLEAARKGDVLFYREAELAPGKYTLEAVAYDAVAGKASVRARAFEVPSADEHRVRLSSLMLVRRAEEVGASEQKDGPLYYGNMLLYPNMGEPYKKSTAKALSFFFSALSPKDGLAPGQATVEVWRGAQAIGQVATQLPAPDAQGRIQTAGTLPLSGFAPGAYELKVTLRDGKSVASSSAPFTVEE